VKTDLSRDNAVVEANQVVDRAMMTEKWMIVTWRVVDGQLRMDRVTCDFPDGDLPETVQMLQRSVQEERRSKKSCGCSCPTPLPRADVISIKDPSKGGDNELD
jgi:hypothetical protein